MKYLNVVQFRTTIDKKRFATSCFERVIQQKKEES